METSPPTTEHPRFLLCSFLFWNALHLQSCNTLSIMFLLSAELVNNLLAVFFFSFSFYFFFFLCFFFLLFLLFYAFLLFERQVRLAVTLPGLVVVDLLLFLLFLGLIAPDFFVSRCQLLPTHLVLSLRRFARLTTPPQSKKKGLGDRDRNCWRYCFQIREPSQIQALRF